MKIMKNLLFIALFLLTTSQIAGQSHDVDSLVNVLKTQQLTTAERLELLKSICGQYLENDNEKVIFYGSEGLKLAEKEKDRENATSFYHNLGIAYYSKSSYDTATVYLQKALDLAVETNDKVQQVKVYMATGNLYRRQARYDEAISFYTKSMAVSESINNRNNIATALVNIGNVHKLTGNFQKSNDFLEQAKEISKDLNDNYLTMFVYYSIGSNLETMLQLDKALEYVQTAYEISQAIGDKKFEISALYSLAKISYKSNDFDKAHDYIEQSVHLAEEYGDPRLLMGVLIGNAHVYWNQQYIKESVALLLKAWQIDSVDLHYAKDVAFFLTRNYIFLGNQEQAYYYLNKYNDLLAKRNDKQYQDALANMEVMYETRQKEARIASLEKERRLYVWLIIFGGLLLVASVLSSVLTIWNARKQRQLIANDAILQGEIGERTRIAEDLHDRLGGSLTAVKMELKKPENIHNLESKIDMCIKELREITNNIMPHSLQKSGLKGALEDFCANVANLNFHFFGEEMRIRQNQEYAVYCCARELVNNALKYADANLINVQIVQSKQHVSLTVYDDGCGFDEKKAIKGHGLENIRNRVASCKGKFDITSFPGMGTEAVVELPVSPLRHVK